MKTSVKLSSLFVLATLVFFSVSCSDNDDHGELEVMMTYTPNPATVNTPIEITFEVEEGGEHKAVEEVGCEIEKEGTGNHVEIEIHADHSEVGHYHGEYTFTEAGEYEVHFNFRHDSEPNEKEFTITVQ